MTYKRPLTCALLCIVTMALVGPASLAPNPGRFTAGAHSVESGSSATSPGDAVVAPGQASRKRSPRHPGAGGGAGLERSRGPGPRGSGLSDPSSPDRTWVEDAGIPETPVGRAAGDRLVVQRALDTHQVALTFDDGPDAATPRVLELLRKNQIKATFCVIGVNVRAHPELVRQIAADGHSLCNHTLRHDLHLGTRGVATIRADLQQTADAIHQAAPGAPIRYFRHPGGNFTPASNEVAKELGMISLGWNVDPNDWNLTKFPVTAARTEHVVNVVTSQTRPGAIILSHDGGGDRSATIAAYERLLPWLKARYELVALPA